MDRRLQAELDRVHQAVRAQLQAAREAKMAGPKILPVVYHYTDAKGLKAILESGDIWMGDIFSMNDPSELIWGVCAAMEAAENRAKNASRPVQVLAAKVQKIPGLRVARGARFTAVSFSMADDDLGQWRAYGDDGAGYAIAFHTPAIVGAFSASQPAVKLAPEQEFSGHCFTLAYDDAELARRQAALVNVVLDAAEVPLRQGMSLADDDPFYESLFDTLDRGVIETCLGFKHMAYANEKEYRFLLSAVGINPSNSFMHQGIFKTKFNWRVPHPDAIAGVLVGPALDYATADAFIQETLRTRNLPPVPTEKSMLPYRRRARRDDCEAKARDETSH